jgi:hypothetical protein
LEKIVDFCIQKKKKKCKYFNDAKGCKFKNKCNNIHIEEKSIFSEKEQFFLKKK